MANALKKISARAKQLQRQYPNSKWTALIKKASAEYRNGSIGGTRKKSRGGSGNDSSKGAGHTSTSTKATTTGNRTATKTITAHVKVGGLFKKKKRNSTEVVTYATARDLTIPAAKHFLKKQYEEKLAWALLRRDQSYTKKNKKYYQNIVVMYRNELKKIK